MNECVVCDASVIDPKEAYKQRVAEIINYFGGRPAAMETLGYKSRQTFYQWVSSQDMTADVAWKIQGLSNGTFLAVELSSEAATQVQIRDAHLHIGSLLKRSSSN